MKIELFVLIGYSPNIQEARRMVCEWEYEDVRLGLVETTFEGFLSYQLLVRSKTDIGAPKWIVLNNGTDEIRVAANQRAPNLLQVIREHNPDMGALLDQQVAVCRAMVAGSVGAATTTAATKPRRL